MPSPLPCFSSPNPKVHFEVFSEAFPFSCLLLLLSEDMQGCFKENKMTCPVSRVGFWSGLLSGFLEEGTHYLVHTEGSA